MENIDKDRAYKCIHYKSVNEWAKTVLDREKIPFNARECIACNSYQPMCERYDSGRMKKDITGTKAIVDNVMPLNWLGLEDDYTK